MSTTPRLTAEQRRALDALTPKRRAFVLAYVGEACGNATEAARIAGYAKPHPEGAQLLRKPTVRVALDAIRGPAEDAKIATLDELRAVWSRMALDGVAERTIDGQRVVTPLGDRELLKASELLAKSIGGFIERREVSGPGGGPIQNEVRAVLIPGPVAHELASDAGGNEARALPRGEDGEG